MARSMRSINSRFNTGFPSAFFQPFRFQPGIHFVTELMTYWESAKTTSGSSANPASAVSSRSLARAVNSPTLLVARSNPPAAQASSETTQAQPAGPGLPNAEPSTAAVIVMG